MNKKDCVIIVDDIEVNRAILKELFQDEYDILEAENGEECLKIIRRTRKTISVLLLDIVMPKMDGFQVLKILKQQGYLKYLPVIMITAQDGIDSEIRALELGASDIIQKPFDPYIIQRRVGNIIELYRHKFELESLVKEQTEELRIKNEELEMLARNIPGGVFRYSAEGDEQFDFISQGMLNLFCSEEKEFRDAYKNKFSLMIYEEDRERVLKEIEADTKKGVNNPIEYRVETMDGRLLWLYATAQLVKDKNGKPWYYVVVVDITGQKEAQEDIRISEERYKMIMEKSDSIIYEWDIQTDAVQFSDVWRKKFGYAPPEKHFRANLEKRGHVHPEDVQRFMDLLDQSKAGLSYGEVSVRIAMETEGYCWIKFCNMLIPDRKRSTGHVLGIGLDVDKEMRKSQQLRLQAERDYLTKLYNKGTTESLIKSYLEDEGKGKLHALLIVDVDNFKGINDSLGHPFGDTVLSKVASKMKEYFRSTDVLGRIGGDEFIVFVKDIRDISLVDEKARDICEAFRKTITPNGRLVSASVGVSISGQDGETFEELFEKADIALYEVKKAGRNNYQFYNNSMTALHNHFTDEVKEEALKKDCR